MLIIEFKNPNPNFPGVQIKWYVGQTLDLNDPKLPISMVQAEGPELAYILHHFDNIPSARNKQVQRWRGDFAAFIVDHLPIRFS